MLWKIEADRHVCLGTGMCAGSAPEYFELDETGRVQVLHSNIEPNEAVTDAASLCPVEAIRVREAASGKTLAPL
ncbi:MAG TPA: cytochrome [Micromonosporaceae bacterium]|nr:cytochrome [Micromonosporaceae bacterium]HCU48528.1 cytochrome [Micromonosporaceae bacterium]